MEEEHRVLRAFHRDGFDRSERATHIVADEHREEYFKRLAETGINVEEMTAAGELEVLPWTEMYVRDHHFDQGAMLDSVEESIQSGAHAGYHPRHGFSGERIRIETPPTIIASIPTLISTARGR